MLEDREHCVICLEPLDWMDEAVCQMCDRKFHHPWTQNRGEPQCGRIASHEEALPLVFLCEDCYFGNRP